MASATFPGKDFCLTLPHKVDRLHMRGLVPEYVNRDGETIKLNDVLKEGKCFVFLPSAELNETQKNILKRKNVRFSIFNQSLEKASTGVSYGLTPGSVMFGDDRQGVGYTFDIDVCISFGEMALKNLTTF